MPEPRIIRKHSNRRLWDPLRRGYAVLDDIQNLVVAGTEFNVIDNDRADVTWATLMQVITSLERSTAAALTTEFLRQTIRTQAESPSGLAATFLEQTLRLLRDMPGERDSSVKAAGDPTVGRRLAEANFKRWQSVQRMIHQVLAHAGSKDNSPAGAAGALIGLLPTQRCEPQPKGSPRSFRVMTRRSERRRRPPAS